MNIDLSTYREEVAQELNQILAWWMRYTPDLVHGGFFGQVDNDNRPDASAPKGLVMNSRILWTFSAAFLQTGNKAYLPVAQRAYEYLIDHFIDKEKGGAFWSLDYNGQVLNDRKQVYGLAFCIYGLSEYYKASSNQDALHHAIAIFGAIEKHGFDEENKGYFEAFSRDWGSLQDMRLSDKDANEKKTMNTHLHLIEAYANLYSIWPDPLLKKQIENLLDVFACHIQDTQSGHLLLFFDERWSIKSDTVSYGHDIEAAWLLLEAAEKIDNRDWMKTLKRFSLKTVNAAMEGLDADGGLWYEYHAAKNHLLKEKHWWPQAEAMVGFMNACEITQNETYLQHSLNSWQFIKNHIRDRQKGEWFWGTDASLTALQGYGKAGFWKCPYHNGRACMEIMKRISSSIKEKN